MGRIKNKGKRLEKESQEWWDRKLLEEGLSMESGRSRHLVYVGGHSALDAVERIVVGGKKNFIMNQEGLPNDSSLDTSSEFDTNSFEEFVPSARMDVLLKMSSKIVRVLKDSELAKKRAAFDRVKNKKFPMQGMCWVCREREAQHRHHVVLLKHGGSVTGKNNVVLLCEECHSEVHPWLSPFFQGKTYDRWFIEAYNKLSNLLFSTYKGEFSGHKQDFEAKVLEISSFIFNKIGEKS